MTTTRRALLGLGSNMGDRVEYLRAAVAAIPDVVAVSDAYETDPVGGVGPQAISITERLFERELGQVARELVAMVDRCDPSSEVPVDAFAHTADDEIDDGGVAEPDDD